MQLPQLLKEARRDIGIGLMVLTLIFALTSRAQAYLFDPDGAGALPATNIGSLDWGPTSFLAVGGTNAIGAFQSSGGTCTTACDFTVLVQAKMIGTLDSGGNALPGIPGLNSTFEITMVASLTERVTGVATGVGNLNIAAFTTQSTGSLNIFFDLSPDSSQLTGSGFNDGRVILAGSSLLSGITGSFSVDTTKPLTALDSTGANDYTGQLTVQGSGSQPSIPFDSLISDPAFFTELLAQFGIQFSNISTGLPFDSVDPMTCFDPSATTTAVGSDTPAGQNCEGQGHVNGTYAAQILGPNGGVIPNVGTNNGLFPAQGGGPDFVAQTDFNSPLTTEKISEPASFLLFGFGLLGMGGYLRARTRKTK